MRKRPKGTWPALISETMGARPFTVPMLDIALRERGVIEPSQTLRGYLNRLVDKGILTAAKEGRHVFYTQTGSEVA